MQKRNSHTFFEIHGETHLRGKAGFHCDTQRPAKMPKLLQNRDGVRPGKEVGIVQALLHANMKVVLLRYK